jgi:hypothetical protein
MAAVMSERSTHHAVFVIERNFEAPPDWVLRHSPTGNESPAVRRTS